jgi:hypothetical protein
MPPLPVSSAAPWVRQRRQQLDAGGRRIADLEFARQRAVVAAAVAAAHDGRGAIGIFHVPHHHVAAVAQAQHRGRGLMAGAGHHEGGAHRVAAAVVVARHDHVVASAAAVGVEDPADHVAAIGGACGVRHRQGSGAVGGFIDHLLAAQLAAAGVETLLDEAVVAGLRDAAPGDHIAAVSLTGNGRRRLVAVAGHADQDFRAHRLTFRIEGAGIDRKVLVAAGLRRLPGHDKTAVLQPGDRRHPLRHAGRGADVDRAAGWMTIAVEDLHHHVPAGMIIAGAQRRIAVVSHHIAAKHQAGHHRRALVAAGIAGVDQDIAAFRVAVLVEQARVQAVAAAVAGAEHFQEAGVAVPVGRRALVNLVVAGVAADHPVDGFQFDVTVGEFQRAHALQAIDAVGRASAVVLDGDHAVGAGADGVAGLGAAVDGGIGAATAVDRIVAATAGHGVVAQHARQDVGAAVADQVVIAAAATQRFHVAELDGAVGAGAGAGLQAAAEGRIAAVNDAVHAGAAVDGVVAAMRGEDLAGRAAGQAVGELRAFQFLDAADDAGFAEAVVGHDIGSQVDCHAVRGAGLRGVQRILVAGAAEDGVLAGRQVEEVASRAAVHQIVAAVADAADEEIVTVAAQFRVVAGATQEVVAAAIAPQRVVAGAALDIIAAVARAYHIVASIAEHSAAGVAADGQVFHIVRQGYAVIAEDGIDALRGRLVDHLATLDDIRIVAGAAVQRVVAATAIERIVAIAAVKGLRDIGGAVVIPVRRVVAAAGAVDHGGVLHRQVEGDAGGTGHAMHILDHRLQMVDAVCQLLQVGRPTALVINADGDQFLGTGQDGDRRAERRRAG